MRALEALSTGASPHSCPFCRTGDGLDEYVHPVLERTYLISTSRIHAASSAQLQTVHVLKDITDRREAERRYRELFDNIQEGIFFSTPQGRFVEVNDALVRILGYSSREEVLQLDIPTQVYFSRGAPGGTGWHCWRARADCAITKKFCAAKMDRPSTSSSTALPCAIRRATFCSTAA